MPRIVIDGQEFDVPDEVTAEDLKGTGNLDPEDSVYRIRDGKHEILGDKDSVKVEEGSRFGRLRPFTTGANLPQVIEMERDSKETTDLFVPRPMESKGDLVPITGRELKEKLGADPEDTPIIIRDGKHISIADDEMVTLAQNEKVTWIRPFITGERE